MLGLTLFVCTVTSHPDVYEEADKVGVLLFQDFPLQWEYARTIRTQAVRQATSAVHQLGHHPSLVLWSAHNEPFGNEDRSGVRVDAGTNSTYRPLGSYVQQLSLIHI